MAFDPSTATPIGGGFDPSTAQEVAPPRSALAEIGTAAKRGLFEGVQGTGALLQAPAEMAGAQPGILSKVGSALEQYGKEHAAANAAQPESHGGVTDFLAQAAAAPGQSLPVLAGAIGGSAAGSAVAPGVGTIAGGALGGGSAAALQAWHEKYQEGLAKKLSDADARTYADNSAALQGAGMAAMSGIPFLGPVAGKFVGGAAKTAAEAGADALGKRFLPEFAKQAAEIGVANTGIGVGTAAGQAAIDQNAGIETPTPGEAATSAILPSIAGAVGFLPLGALHARATAKEAASAQQALADPATDAQARAKAALAVHAAMQPVDPAGAAQWAANAASAIRHGLPVGLDDAWAQGPHPDAVPPVPEPLPALPAPTPIVAGQSEPPVPNPGADAHAASVYAARDAEEARLQQLASSGPIGTAAATAIQSGAVQDAQARRQADIDEADHAQAVEAAAEAARPKPENAAPEPAPVEPPPAQPVSPGASFPFPTLDAARKRAAFVSQQSGEDYVAAPHPTMHDKFAVVPKEEADALQEQSAGSLFQREPEQAGSGGSERAGVESGEQGNEPASQGTEETAPAVGARADVEENPPDAARPGEGTAEEGVGAVAQPATETGVISGEPGVTLASQPPPSETEAPTTTAAEKRAKSGENLPATVKRLFVERGGQRFPVDSIEDAAQRWGEFRDRTGAGASQIGGARIVDQDGNDVARISYNGKVWPPGEWQPGMRPLVGESFKPSSTAAQPLLPERLSAERASAEPSSTPQTSSAPAKPGAKVPEMLLPSSDAKAIAQSHGLPDDFYAPEDKTVRVNPKYRTRAYQEALTGYLAARHGNADAALKFARAMGNEFPAMVERARAAKASGELAPEPEPVAPQPPAPKERSDKQKANDERLRALAVARAKRASKIDVHNDSIVTAIAKLGGINPEHRKDITGDTVGSNPRVPFVGALFRGKSRGSDGSPDVVAQDLAQYHYLTPQEMDDVDGGVQALKDKIADEIAGTPHYSAHREADVAEARDDHDVEEQFGADNVEASGYNELPPDEKALVADAARDWADEVDDDEGFRKLSDAEAEAWLRPVEGEARGDAAGEARTGDEGAEKAPLELTGQSNAEILTDEARATRARQEAEAQAKAPSPESFTLAGSKREADVAAAHGQDPLFSRDDEAPIFHSALAKAFDATPKLKSMPAAQWKSWLAANKGKLGVKDEEIKWSGLDDWLDLQKGPVSRDAVRDFIAQNGVKVQETTLGGAQAEVERHADAVEAQARDEGMTANAAREFGVDAARSELSEAQTRAMSDAMRPLVDRLHEAYQRRGQEGTAEQTKFGQYQLPGGENYRELLLTLPEKPGDSEYTVRDKAGRTEAIGHSREESERIAREIGGSVVKVAREAAAFRSSHFDQPNILAHVRFNDRTDAGGKKVLFIEEIQSDWAQKGRREGFIKPGDDIAKADLVAKPWPDNPLVMEVSTRDGRFVTNVTGTDVGGALGRAPTETEAIAEARRRVVAEPQRTARRDQVPAAPFVGKTEAWTALALKRMIRYAAEHGYDRVAWTNGEQQAARYDLSKHIESIGWTKARDGQGVHLLIHGKDGQRISDRRYENAQLADTIGKELADKILASPDREGGFNGLDLKVGGEGMRAFYDKIVPNVANDVLKKLGGGKVTQADMVTSPLDLETVAQRVYGERYGDLPVESRRQVVAVSEKNMTPQPGFDITPKMREQALAGMPLFNRADAAEPPPRFVAVHAFGRWRVRDESGQLGFVGSDYATQEKAQATAEILSERLAKLYAQGHGAGATGEFDARLHAYVNIGAEAPELLSTIAKESSLPFNRQLATRLQALGVEPHISGGLAPESALHGERGHVAGAYDRATNTVSLFTARNAERHLLHEFVHAATAAAIDRGTLGGRQMKALYEAVKASGEIPKGTYGMTSVHEFTAEAFANPKFQALLDGVKSTQGKSLWQRFVEGVRRILGLPVENETALDDALRVGAQVMEENRAAREVSANAPLFSKEDGSTPRPIELMPKVTRGKAAESEAQFTKSGKVLREKDAGPQPVGRDLPKWLAGMPEGVAEAARKGGAWVETKPLKQRLKEQKHEAGLRILQATTDQYASILNRLGDMPYKLARMASAYDAGVETLMHFGQIYLNKAGAIARKENSKGALDILKPLGGEADRFMLWMAGQRADRLSQEDREHNFGDADISALKSLNGKLHANDNFADGRDGKTRAIVYAGVLKEWMDVNRSMLDMAVEGGTMDRKTADRLAEQIYVPFFRAQEDGAQAVRMGNTSGLVNQYFSKRLKGGEGVLHDLLANTVQNWSHIVQSTLKNNAATNILEAAEAKGYAHKVADLNRDAREAGFVPKEMSDGQVFVLKNGKAVYYVVDDPLLLDSVSALSASPFRIPKSLAWFKHALTVGTTMSPVFRVRHTIREQIASLILGHGSYNPVKNWIDGFQYSSRNNPEYGNMLAGGSFFRMGYGYEDNRGAYFKQLLAHDIDPSTLLDSPAKVKRALGGAWEWWKETGERSDSITRANRYRQTYAEMIAAGKSPDEAHFEASYAARSTLDYGLHGTSAAVKMITGVVPFMNARLQGLYVIGKAAHADPQRFATVVGGVTLATIALSLAYRDDKEMQAREEWDKDSNWAFRIGDKLFRVPKPFELGAIATVADRALEVALNGFKPSDRERFVERLWPIIGSQLNMNPIASPLIATPIQLWGNKDWFSGRSIESYRDEKMRPTDRIGANTSQTAIGLSNAMNAVLPDAGTLSPEQIDFAVNSFFGWVGVHALMTADLALRPMTGAPSKPAARIDDLPVIGDFVKSLPENQSRDTEAFYQHLIQVQQAMGSMRSLQQTGQAEKAVEFMKANKDTIALNGLYLRTQRALGALGKQARYVQMRDISPDEKRVELDRIAQQKNALTAVAEKARAATLDRQ